MSVSAEAARQHIEYTAWATGRLLDAASELPDADARRDFLTADKSVVGTLAHIFFADRLWLARVTGEPFPGLLRQEEQSIAHLRTAFPELHAQWRKWGAGLSDAAMAHEIAYRDMKQNHHQQPLWEILLHVVNHASHHRGQVAGFLRAIGRTPPNLDLIGFYRGRH